MRESGYKTVDARRGGARVLLLLFAVVVAGTAVFVAGRASAPERAAPVGYSDRLVRGVPVGFAGTPRGAGDAAAAYVVAVAAAAGRPDVERQTLIDIIAVDGSGPAVAEMMGAGTPPAGNAGISQTMAARVWVSDVDLNAQVPAGGEVTARLLVCALTGSMTDGVVAGPQTGLAGGWYVQSVTVRWTQGRWRVVVAQRPVPVPPPDQRGARRDGGPRDTQPLLDVLSARSWVPGTV
ncbi:hypothetical protein DER29_5935 [Micromonospora sp. M71_S20]|uniref:hypothetical protein n=1 Tax=Micromonospora sp. M71_S20 TaxID=592872 RepID=UPI000F2B977B|nr:hypothetical protein [Micromonospora sp. M71_S20]RLK12652.1 hypothetical protein DER29_5935 [Micromonospora sp. M71_S20]